MNAYMRLPCSRFPFHWSRGPAYKMVPPILRVYVPISANEIEIVSHTHARRPAWSRQAFIQTFFLDSSRLCHVDNKNQAPQSLKLTQRWTVWRGRLPRLTLNLLCIRGSPWRVILLPQPPECSSLSFGSPASSQIMPQRLIISYECLALAYARPTGLTT